MLYLNIYREYTPELEVEFTVYKAHVMSGHNRKSGFGQLMTKLNRALAADAFYDEQVLK